MNNSIIVLSPGFHSTFQDLGRKTHLSLGFPRGGAMDQKALTLLNLLLGNHVEAVGLEYSQHGPSLQFKAPAVVAVGAETCQLTLDGTPVRPWTEIPVEAGQTLSCGVLSSGTWGYLAIKGGFLIKKQYGSASTHLHLGLGGFNGRAIKEGDEIPALSSALSKSPFPLGLKGISRRLLTDLSPAVIRCVTGAQWNWFREESRILFTTQSYVLSATSNRVGYRLEGEPLQRTPQRRDSELCSEGTNVGTVQIPHSGHPIVLMRDAQCIGGYPKLAHVITVDLPKLAQLPPGSQIRFQLISHENALILLREQERSYLALRASLSLTRR